MYNRVVVGAVNVDDRPSVTFFAHRFYPPVSGFAGGFISTVALTASLVG